MTDDETRKKFSTVSNDQYDRFHAAREKMVDYMRSVGRKWDKPVFSSWVRHDLIQEVGEYEHIFRALIYLSIPLRQSLDDPEGDIRNLGLEWCEELWG